jgi:DNA-binding MarR family transcriptional regulator
MDKQIKSVKNEINLQREPWLEEAVHSIFAASAAFETYVNTKHHKYGITQRGIAILHGIALSNGKLSQKRIPKLLNRSKQAVASVLANLEKRGLIVRETVGQDRRRRLVRITEEGLRIAGECLPLRKQFYDCVRSCVSQSEAEHLVSILKTLSARFTLDMRKSDKSRETKIAQED